MLWTCGMALSAPSAPETHFQFRMPHPATFRCSPGDPQVAGVPGSPKTLRASPNGKPEDIVEFGDRIVLQGSPDDLKKLTAGRPLVLARKVTPDLWILQAPDAWTAAREAHRLAQSKNIAASYPVISRAADLCGPYAPLPTDFLFDKIISGTNTAQWYLENRRLDGSKLGPDLNVRSAWPITHGEGITLAVADSGIEMTHPELVNQVAGQPHFNFVAQSSNGSPVSTTCPVGPHGTEVAGLALADLNHARMTGVAPGSHLASWVIFQANGLLASDERVMEMFQYASNIVSVQNHSWAHPGLGQNPATPLEQIGISNATTFGRGGRGVVMVRPAGNDRVLVANANDDGYVSDPRVIAVGAIRADGRVTTYSEPGACLLVSAPGGDSSQGLFTTDLVGTRGCNQITFCPPTNPNCEQKDLSDYVWGSLGFSGTSASTPFVAGVAALVLSANPYLTFRDVQQMLILSSRHFDYADPDVATNAAGFIVSHNVGFGVPDAGEAVRLARTWSNRPPQIVLTVTNSQPVAIPDDGLRVTVTGDGVPAELASIPSRPGTGPHPDQPTLSAPLVDIGLATNVPSVDLTGKGALILRGSNNFDAKIINAAKAGAAFAIIYNYPGSNDITGMLGTDFVPIPAVFISNRDGDALKALFQTNTSARAQLSLQTGEMLFQVTTPILCEHVGVRVQSDHARRGDLRITLVSPGGTRSVLQASNEDTNAGPAGWIYWSTHHFYENGMGGWRICVSDQRAGTTGSLIEAGLIVTGVSITDSDVDGLDDDWEMASFSSLTFGPKDDPDCDGLPNAREQIVGTNPNARPALMLDLSPYNASLLRLSWPGSPCFAYDILSANDVTALTNIVVPPSGELTRVYQNSGEIEWFYSKTNHPWRFHRVYPVPPP